MPSVSSSTQAVLFVGSPDLHLAPGLSIQGTPDASTPNICELVTHIIHAEFSSGI